MMFTRQYWRIFVKKNMLLNILPPVSVPEGKNWWILCLEDLFISPQFHLFCFVNLKYELCLCYQYFQTNDFHFQMTIPEWSCYRWMTRMVLTILMPITCQFVPIIFWKILFRTINILIQILLCVIISFEIKSSVRSV